MSMTAHINSQQGVYRWVVAILLLFAVCLLEPGQAYAQYVNQPAGSCTTDIQFNPPPPSMGIITRLVIEVASALGNFGDPGFWYNKILLSPYVGMAIGGAFTFYVIMYGILFTTGMIQLTAHDFVMRMVKMSFIAWLLIPGANSGWAFFSGAANGGNGVVQFFNNGTNQIIGVMTSSVAGMPALGGATVPFSALDNFVFTMFSQKMVVTLMAILFTGPYGAFVGLLVVTAFALFSRALLTALWIYLMSLILRTLLFATAPFFIACALFQRSKYIFDGWLNQVLNTCLQPILLFTFFAFYVNLLGAIMSSWLAVPVCWTETSETLRGTPFYMHWWRFTYNGEPYGNLYSFLGPGNGMVFPIQILDILMFFVLAELAIRFNNVAVMIAYELSSVSLNFSQMGSIFSGGKPVGSGGRPGHGGAQHGPGATAGKAAKEKGAVENLKERFGAVPGKRDGVT